MDDERIRRFVITTQFLRSVRKLAQQQSRKVWESLDKFARDPNSPGLNREPLSGGSKGLYSIRVDRDHRIIFSGGVTPVLLFVGSHDDAYRAAERVAPLVEEGEPLLYQRVGVAPVEAEPQIQHLWTSNPSFRGEMTRGAAISSEQLGKLILRTRKYLPITEFLTGRPPEEDCLQTTFERIEQALGKPLPESARQYRAWWANDPSHVQATAWLAAGWGTRDVQLDDERVSFVRLSG